MEHKTGARMGSDLFYLDICIKNYKSYISLRPEYDKLNSELESMQIQIDNSADHDYLMYRIYEKKSKIEDKLAEHCIIAITFAAMFLEAYIYDFAAWLTSDKYTKTYLSNLDFVAKWIIIPRLLLGKEIPTNSKAISSLKRLRTARNRLIHSKSKNIAIPIEDILKYAKEMEEFLPQEMQNALITIIEIRKELILIAPKHVKIISFPEIDEDLPSRA